MSSRYSGQDLTANDTVDHAVAKIGEYIQCAAYFAGIVSHKEASHDLPDGRLAHEFSHRRDIKFTRVRHPLMGPHVLTYPTVHTPRRFPNTAHKAASLKLRPSTNVPIDPTIMLFVASDMLNHMSSMCNEVEAVTGCRSSNGTGSIPRASPPPFKTDINRCHVDLGLVSGSGSLSSLLGVVSSSNWLSLRKEGEPFSRSDFMINVQGARYVQSFVTAIKTDTVVYPSR